MSGEYTLKITPEQAQEMPMVDLAFLILKAANTPFYYRDLMMEVAKVKGISEENIKEVMAQVYTEINIDGRFACVGKNLWGLKRWYPVEKTEDPLGSAGRPRIINDEDDDDLDEVVFEDEGFDSAYDEDEDVFADGVDDEEIDDAADLDDEELDEDFADDLDEDMSDEVLDDELPPDDEEEPDEEFDDFEEEEDR
jgi:DNA-directed RNA polymerase subunit delta